MRVRCPNCYDSTEVDDSTALSAVQCASCGSKFSLVADHTLTYTEAETKTIGHFELVDEIGAGAFGSVWMAKDTQLDRSVAVKIPRPRHVRHDASHPPCSPSLHGRLDQWLPCNNLGGVLIMPVATQSFGAVPEQCRAARFCQEMALSR